MSFASPQRVDSGPVAVLGAGTLGRRIALMLCTRGGEVRLFDISQKAREEGLSYVRNTLPSVVQKTRQGKAGRVIGTDDLTSAVDDTWLVIEAVPEKLQLKKSLFAQLDEIAPPDCILASNSSSYPTSRFIDGVRRPERVVNTHFYMPPERLAVEIMSCGKTDERVIDLLMARFPEYGLVPFKVLRESVGFIYNRVWAAIKRESLAVVAEGVSTPQDVDRIYQLVNGTSAGPFRRMDMVGLDVVLDIEEHYAAVREGVPEGARRLLRDYVSKGWLGAKSGRGFYDDYRAAEEKEDASADLMV